jgi:hypothetical protein
MGPERPGWTKSATRAVFFPPLTGVASGRYERLVLLRD